MSDEMIPNARGGFMQRPLAVKAKKITAILLAAATLALIALSRVRIQRKTVPPAASSRRRIHRNVQGNWKEETFFPVSSSAGGSLPPSGSESGVSG